MSTTAPNPDAAGPSLGQTVPTGFGVAGTLLSAAVIVFAGILAYYRSLPYPFVFDDDEAIAENPYIDVLWPPAYLYSEPPQSAVAGRPVVSLTLAVDHHFGDLKPSGYRAFNLVVHLLAGLVLLGIVRRTLSSARLRDRFGSAATSLAAASALLWTLHLIRGSPMSPSRASRTLNRLSLRRSWTRIAALG